MIQHILKIIWNERKTNAWLFVGYILTFCVLWFATDYLYTMLRSYYGDRGFCIENVYEIRVGEKLTFEAEGIDRYALSTTFLERVRRHPDVEYVSLSWGGLPFGGAHNAGVHRVYPDSIDRWVRQRQVTSEFFDVFRINVEGRIFDWTDHADRHSVIISPFMDDRFGFQFGTDIRNYIPISEIDTIWNTWQEDTPLAVIGTTAAIQDVYFQPSRSNVFMPFSRGAVNLPSNEITIRVRPETGSDFAERFAREMRDQLAIEPFFLSTVTSLRAMEREEETGQRSRMNGVYAITLFLVVNIFLGILGSFWFRVQSRRSEIGLRLALGSSRKKIQGMMLLETMVLLTTASIIATIICLRLLNHEVIAVSGIPQLHRELWGIGVEQNFINFGITFGFLALVSALAVWYPARQAARIMPAETLSEE